MVPGAAMEGVVLACIRGSYRGGDFDGYFAYVYY